MESGEYSRIMKLRSIQVECYSGGRGDERPRRVVVDGQEHLVIRLLGESIEEDAGSKDRITRFIVRTDQGLTIELLRDDSGNWYLVSIRV